MSRGGRNWKGSGTVDGTRSLDVMRLLRSGYLSERCLAGWRWAYPDGTRETIVIDGGGDRIVLRYNVRNGHDPQAVEQRVPIHWTPCRLGGKRPWFICDVHANGIYCGRKVTKLYDAGRLFACRHCCRLGYAMQRIGPLDQAHYRLGRLHRKLSATYGSPDMPAPPKPKWMRWRTYDRITQQIRGEQSKLEEVFMAGAQRILARIVRQDSHRRSRR